MIPAARRSPPRNMSTSQPRRRPHGISSSQPRRRLRGICPRRSRDSSSAEYVHVAAAASPPRNIFVAAATRPPRNMSTSQPRRRLHGISSSQPRLVLRGICTSQPRRRLHGISSRGAAAAARFDLRPGRRYWMVVAAACSDWLSSRWSALELLALTPQPPGGASSSFGVSGVFGRRRLGVRTVDVPARVIYPWWASAESAGSRRRRGHDVEISVEAVGSLSREKIPTRPRVLDSSSSSLMM